jgi:uncharacterized membrane protein YsdA (DUF1294 family)
MTAPDILKITGLFLALNGLVFSIYFLDKQAARHHRRRVIEKPYWRSHLSAADWALFARNGS